MVRNYRPIWFPEEKECPARIRKDWPQWYKNVIKCYRVHQKSLKRYHKKVKSKKKVKVTHKMLKEVALGAKEKQK